jgi:limonene-1,2-epoxide hydrolase
MKTVLHGSLGSIAIETSPFTIGSSPDNSLVIDNIKVSAHHAELRSEENDVSITDLGSIHGTFVNGERLDFNSSQLLNPGDSIAIGDSVFTYDAEDAHQNENTIPMPDELREGDRGTSEQYLSNHSTAQNQESTSEIPEDQSPVEGNSHYFLSQQDLQTPTQQTDSEPFIPSGFDGTIPGYMSLKRVHRRDRRFIFLGLGLLVVIALAFGGYIYFNRSTPDKTLDTFCSAMQKQDYQTAYNQLAYTLQNIEMEGDFANTLRANGKVNTCSHGSTSTVNNKATAKVTIITGNGQASSSNVTLISDDTNTWKLSLFPTTPSMTLTAFCNALQNKDYPTAFAQLTNEIKRLHAEAQFEADFANLTCSYGNISQSGSTATSTVVFKTSSGQIASAKVALVQDGDSTNNWKINSIQFS